MTLQFLATGKFSENIFDISLNIENIGNEILREPFYLLDNERGKIRLSIKENSLLPAKKISTNISYKIKNEKEINEGIYQKKYKVLCFNSENKKVISNEIVVEILKSNFYTIIKEETGILPPQEFNIINSNIRLHEFDLRDAYEATFNLSWDNPNAFLKLYVYSSQSIYNNLDSDYYTLSNPANTPINNIISSEFQRMEGRFEGSDFSSLTATVLPGTVLTPDKYIVQVINEESNVEVNYTVTVKYTVNKNCHKNKKENPFVGFWENATRQNNYISFRIYEMSDKSLRYQFYFGDSFNGYYPTSIFSSPLLETESGYYEFISYFIGEKYTLYLNQKNLKEMYEINFYIGNETNNQPIIIRFYRNDNPKLINFLDSNDLSTPLSLFENFFNNYFLQGNVQFSRDFQSDDYPGIQKITSYKNKIISNGINEEFVGIDVWPEMSIFEESYGTTGIVNPIKTYAPITVNNTIVTANFSLLPRGNQFIFRIPTTELEPNMLVELTGMKGLPEMGLPSELVNGLYRIVSIITSPLDPGFQIISFVTTGTLLNRIRILNYPAYPEAEINIIPQCIRVTTIPRNINLIGGAITFSVSIVKLENFSAVGGLSAEQINRRYSVYFQKSNTEVFLTLQDDLVASETTTGGISGLLSVCTFPDTSVLNNTLLQNRFTLKNTPSPSTVFFTTEPPLLNVWSQVKISGFKGVYERLNGTHQAHISEVSYFDFNVTPDIWKEGYYIPNRKYSCTINVNSEGLPSFNPEIHTVNGKSYKFERIINKIDNDSSYDDFADACGYLIKKSGVNTHQSSVFYYNIIDGKRNLTWEKLQKIISTGIIFFVNVFNRGFDSTGAIMYKPPSIQDNPYLNNGNVLNKSAYNDIRGNPINHKLRVNISDLFFNLRVSTFLRYLDIDQIHQTYSKISGELLNERVPGSDPNGENISNFLIDQFYNRNGTIIDYYTEKWLQNTNLTIFILRNSPTSFGANALNAFILSGFKKELIDGEMILANPPNALVPLINASECVNRIVFVVQIAGESNDNFRIKYENAVNAGAKLVVVIASINITTTNFTFPVGLIPSGPINNVMYYVLPLSQGNSLVGFSGTDRNNPANYSLPTTASNGFLSNIFHFPSIIISSSIFFNLKKPISCRYSFRNSFLRDGFLQQEIEGELILANPPDALVPLVNEKECMGKIVCVIQKSTDLIATFNTKYINAVNAGAKTVLIISNIITSNFIYAPGVISGGPINDVMLYATNQASGYSLVGYRGGNMNDFNNYDMPVIDSGEYKGNFEFAGNIVGVQSFIHTIIKPEFTNGKNIGYIYMPQTDQESSFSIDTFPYMWDNYKTDTTIDQTSKMFAEVMKSEFMTPSGIKKLSEMDQIIIDNGSNIGGLSEYIPGLAALFGNNRPALDSIFPYNGSGYAASSTLKQLVKTLPPDNLRTTKFWSWPEEVECSKIQEKYPESIFKGNKLILITSTTAFSGGDIYPHYFRNTRADNPGEIGNGIKSILVGTVDGRIQGYSTDIFYSNYPTKNSILSLIPSVMGITAPIESFSLGGERLGGFYNIYTKKNLTNQVPEIKIDGLFEKEGPIAASIDEEGGFLQAFGFSTVYLRNIPIYSRFNDVLGLPKPYQGNTYHYPYLEDAILTATEE